MLLSTRCSRTGSPQLSSGCCRTGTSSQSGTTGRSVGRSGARQLCGSDLDGVVEHLYHLWSLGVDVPYLTLYFPSRSNHCYDASSFEQVDPALGGAEFIGSPLMVPRLGAPS
jgi:glycosidase